MLSDSEPDNQSDNHSPNDLPILPRSTWWGHGSPPQLRTAFSVHPRRALLRVRCTRQADVCERCSQIAVVSLIDDKCIAWNRFRVHLVRIEEVNELRLRRRSLLRGYESDLVRGGSGRNLDQMTRSITASSTATNSVLGEALRIRSTLE